MMLAPVYETELSLSCVQTDLYRVKRVYARLTLKTRNPMAMSRTAINHEGQGGTNVRDKILDAGSDLFYRQGVRAVGVDLVVEKAGVAKASLYRHFRTKDDLVAAFLGREDLNFWRDWDRVAEQYTHDAREELDAQLDWIGERAGKPTYRYVPHTYVAHVQTAHDLPARQTTSHTHRNMLNLLHAR